MTLDGFKAFNFNEGVPSVSITTNGVTFNRSVLMKLGCPEYVVLLINEDTKQMALQVSNQDTPNAVAFYKGTKVSSVRWNMRDLLNTIRNMMEWDLQRSSYRVEGTLLKDEKAILFDFSKATSLN